MPKFRDFRTKEELIEFLQKSFQLYSDWTKFRGDDSLASEISATIQLPSTTIRSAALNINQPTTVSINLSAFIDFV